MTPKNGSELLLTVLLIVLTTDGKVLDDKDVKCFNENWFKNGD